MAQLTTTELNAVADTEAARWSFISLHTGNPGTTGASEATGGSPAYARKAGVPGAAVSGVVTFAEVAFDAAGGAYTHWGAWSAATGGTFRAGGALAAPQTLSPQGLVKVIVSLTASAS